LNKIIILNKIDNPGVEQDPLALNKIR